MEGVMDAVNIMMLIYDFQEKISCLTRIKEEFWILLI